MISVILITRNEEAMVRRCLESVAWADEIVVVDTASTDATADIARAAGARVEVTPAFPGYGPQKNRALALATHDWVLSIDADEWVDDALRAAILAAVANPGEHAAFRMPRASSFCGRRMRHSGWWPDHVVRLFRRGRARFSDDLVHERLVVDGRIGTLDAPLRHEAVRSLEQAIGKMNSYSSAGARMKLEGGASASLAKAIGHGCWTFVRTYLLRAGFLDGREGFMLAVANAEGAYYRYAKLMLLGEQRDGRR